MQVTVDIPDEVLARLEAMGETPESYVRSLIQTDEQGTSISPPPIRRKRDMRAFFAAMAVNSDRIPILPDEAFTRESFYQDHD